jgi:DNA-binding MarR family transcriptional regulator
MNSYPATSQENLNQAVETFWESFPPFWHRVRAYIHQVATTRFDITVEQFHILRHIRRGLGSVSALAEAKNISRAAVSQAVNILVNKGLVTRATDERDRRHIQLALTDSGNELLDAIFIDTRRWMMQILSSLNDDELQILIQAMDSLRKI